VFFKDSHNFLKFIFFKKYTMKNFFIFFFISEFYDPLKKNFNKKNLIFTDFIMTVNLIFLKKIKYFNFTTQRERIDLFVIHELLNKNKKIIPVNNNAHFEMHQYYLNKFKKLKKEKFIKVFTMYDTF
jgi:hypothetical protein